MTATEKAQAEDLTTLRLHEAQFVLDFHTPEKTKNLQSSTLIVSAALDLERKNQNRPVLISILETSLRNLTNHQKLPK